MSLHGICLGVDALGWHGYGFDAGCSRQQVAKILHVIREARYISRRELLRKLQWLQADQRDAVLERLDHEGLVMLSDRHVSAVSAADYLRTIPARSGIDDSGDAPGPCHGELKPSRTTDTKLLCTPPPANQHDTRTTQSKMTNWPPGSWHSI